MKRLKLLLIFTAILHCNFVEAQVTTSDTTVTKSTYLRSRKFIKTKLLKQLKAPQTFSKLKEVNNTVKLVYYESEGRKLQGLIDTTNIEAGKKKPALLYLHGGFALGYGDIRDCEAFTKAGYIVFAPSYRGENGNEGNYELFGGEVNDAQEALIWLSKQPFIDKDKIFVFGHSIGGGMSLHLSLYPNLPINKSGSCAGLYPPETFAEWAEEDKNLIPFNFESEFEILFRCPVAHLYYLMRPHQMYIGKDDGFSDYKDYLKELYADSKLKLNLIEVEGDHQESLENAIQKFIEHIK
jgi:pimeloyl-ACP methyl ester carboxylesterase